MSDSEFDVVVIGGGSTGTAVARDCAMRGLKTLLLDRDDIASASVGTCAGMISSGLKYRGEPEIVKMCSSEVVHFNHIARHIMSKNPILVPILDFSTVAGDGDYVDSYAEYAEERDVPAMLFLTPEATLEIEPLVHPNVIAGVYYEEFFINPFRLCLLQALDARRHGASIKTYCELVKFETFENEIKGIVYYNRITGATERVNTKIVVNATGPWAHKIARLAGVPLDLRLNKGAHVILDRRIVNVGITTKETVDGRWVYLFPHENTTLLGTTALDTWEDPDALVASYDEIEYLLSSIETVIPSIREARIIRTMAGIRPLVPDWKVPEDQVTRGYRIANHDNGLISFIGGKLVMCRHMAEAVTDLVCRKLGNDAVCTTHEKPLPGNEDDVDIELLSEEYDIKMHVLERMRARRGTEITKILELTKDHPEWKTTICTCEPVIEAEIRYTIREEFPQTLNDLRRRLRIGTGPCQGTSCTFKTAAILSEELNLEGDDFLVDILDFRAERWKGIRPSMRGEQLVQEELAQGMYSCVGNLDQSDVDYDIKPWEEGS